MLKVQGPSIHKKGVSWTADKNVEDARDATKAADLSGVDIMSWWCNNGGGAVAGIAYKGALCADDGYNINLNEKQYSTAASGYVSIY